MRKYLTDTSAYISKLQEKLQILSIFQFDFRFVLIFGNGSFWPRVVSALSRFGPGSFRSGSIRPWVISAQSGGSFRPIFSQLSGLLPKVN